MLERGGDFGSHCQACPGDADRKIDRGDSRCSKMEMMKDNEG
jgi:hypothetical protein